MILSSKVRSPSPPLDAVERDQLVGELLQVNATGKVVEGYGGGSDVTQTLEGIDSPAFTLFGEGVGQIERAAGLTHSQGAEQACG